MEMAVFLALKFKIALVAAAAAPLAVGVVLPTYVGGSGAALHGAPELIELQPGTVRYRTAGDFTHAGRPAEAPVANLRIAHPLAIMKHQVTAADYQRCVADAACKPLGNDAIVSTDRPVVKVSWLDASAYATWLSDRSGQHYRLPTDEEWAFAAGSRYRDDGLPVDSADPAKGWLARYERESKRKETAVDATPRPVGSFGANEYGLVDLAGNVWEWTDTCFVRIALDETGAATGAKTTNCGVRVVEGEHRTYVTDFIRDARAGGCAVGLPPSNLGFRLVREPSLLDRLRAVLVQFGT
jgi:formylglycine-generating enzyme required for sulfatase activity